MQMLFLSMLSYGSFQPYSLFKNYLFFVLLCLCGFQCFVLSSLICSSALSNLFLNLYSIFFSSVIVCFSVISSVWYFLLYSLSLLKFSLCSSILFPSLLNNFMTIHLNSLSGRLLLYIIKIFLSFCLVLLFGIYFFVSSLCLTLFLCIRQDSYFSQSWMSGLV